MIKQTVNLSNHWRTIKEKWSNQWLIVDICSGTLWVTEDHFYEIRANGDISRKEEKTDFSTKSDFLTLLMIMKAIFLEGRNTNCLNEWNLTIPLLWWYLPSLFFIYQKTYKYYWEKYYQNWEWQVKGFEQKNAKKVSFKIHWRSIHCEVALQWLNQLNAEIKTMMARIIL